MIFNANRTSSYLGTVQMDSSEDMGQVRAIRRMVKEANQFSGKKMYVKLQGRGHRRGNRRYNQSLPLEYATSADVYVYHRNVT